MPVRAVQLPEPAVPSPPPGLVTVGRFDQRPGYSISRPGGADSWLFVWTTGGGGRLAQGAAETEAGAGDLVVLGPDLPHHYAVAPGARHWAFWWVHCQARPTWTEWLRPYALGDRLYAVTPVPDGVRGRLDSAFRRMLADARWTGAGAPPEERAEEELDGEPEDGRVAVAHGTAARELTLCSLESAVLLATATARGEPDRSGLDGRIRQAEALIAADPGAPHTVESLATGVSLSPSRFAHLFTQQLGLSPMRALLAARLLHAARLLEATDLPVERVAAASGFSSPFHFNRVFRQRYGAPPGAYRAGLRR
ncbi:helix-turn-helix domain-containing protein [Streptomyces phaeochromogenes]|uniref:helix-turn-helix domain-containing protein n=1 Tax=Streptomyces phaeochromogenes TaxID=1923 RepID=UPI002DDB0CD0|nr:helix-turn-helix domain-containing protein [Streptomyces phaeochromogenes]WRZ27368.1 helix-turn-helix domain-containing protein [Streptomyces phaeochromogenes]WSJ10272.1 helix-turn-helix domain-containing protein [Streptomyces phaeochromogenes]WSW19603.1 helix-turn-helix domain-containing protein [Streptomyces phaeochromogenes]